MMTTEKILEYIKKINLEIYNEITSRIRTKTFDRFVQELKRVDPKVWYKLVNGLLSEQEIEKEWTKYYPRTDKWGRIRPYAPKPKLKAVKNSQRIIVRLKARDQRKFRVKDIKKERRRLEARKRFKKELSITYQGITRWMYDFDRRVFSADLDKEWIEKLRKHPAVAAVEIDTKAYVMTRWRPDPDDVWYGHIWYPGNYPDGIWHIGCPDVHPSNLGGGVSVCIIDTGIDYTHPDISDNYKGGYDFVHNDDDPRDDHGHGTHVAGTIAAYPSSPSGIAGVAPEASLYACKVLNEKGSGSNADVAAGIDWARIHGMDVINMSLGGSYSSVVDQACAAAYSVGVLIVAAAGNSGNGRDTVKYPAKLPSCIAVGATTVPDDFIAYFSSTGPAVEVSAPGYHVKSTCMGGGYCSKDGTSMASPHVAGFAALIKHKHPTYTNAEIRQAIYTNVIDLGTPGHDWYFGYGRIDVLNQSIPYDGYAGLVTEISRIGKERQWQFKTELHPKWSLKSLIDAIGVVQYEFLTGLSPAWNLKSEIEAVNIIEYSFITELPPPDHLKMHVKAQNINPTWRFWTQIPPYWNLKSEAEAKRYFEYSFDVEFDPGTERKGFPEIEIWRSEFSAPLKTIFFNWVKKGVPRDIPIEIWFGKRQYLEKSDVVIGARYFGSDPKQGYDLVKNGYFRIAEQGGPFTPITDEVTFNCGTMRTNSKKDIILRLLVPEGDDITGLVFFEIILAKNKSFLYQDKTYSDGIFGREYEQTKGKIIARAHILP